MHASSCLSTPLAVCLTQMQYYLIIRSARREGIKIFNASNQITSKSIWFGVHFLNDFKAF